MPFSGQDIFSEKSNAIAEGNFAIVPLHPETDESPMPTLPNALQDYVLRVMRENNLTYPDIEKQSKRRGGTIGKSTVQQVATGKTPNPGIFTLVELAWGLNRPVDEVISIAVGAYTPNTHAFEQSEFMNLWEMFRQLPAGEQRIVKRFLQMLDREIRRLLSSQ